MIDNEVILDSHVCKYVDQKGLAAMLGRQKVSRCRTSGESEESIALR